VKAPRSNPFRNGVLADGVVELRIEERFIRTGEVEEVTRDGSIMWVRFHGNHTRQLITKTDGRPQWVCLRG
jgi:hypothetical protein